MSGKRKKSILLLILCLIVLFTVVSCGNKSQEANSTKEISTDKQTEAEDQSVETEENTNSMEENSIDSKKSVDQNDTKKSSEKQGDQKKVSNKEMATQSASNTATSAAKENSQEVVKATKEEKQEGILTIKGSGVSNSITLSMSELNDLGVETYTYSGRSKENDNKRQSISCTGIPVIKILEKAGWNGKANTLKITCSDGYTGKYKISEINGFLAFSDDKDVKGKVVPAMLSILQEGQDLGKGVTYKASNGSPLRLVYGQEDYDTEEMKDFNMQGWGFYVKELEVF